MRLQILHPSNRDLRFALGDLEATVLQQLWETDRSLSVREFQGRISKNHPVAVTTVATILDRLHTKGIVSRELIKEGGPRYVYSARFSEDQFKDYVVRNVMGTLLRGFNDITVAYLAEKMADKPQDRKVLSKYLARLKQKAKG